MPLHAYNVCNFNIGAAFHPSPKGLGFHAVNKMKGVWISYILPALAVSAVAYAAPKAAAAKNQICNQQYALCTSTMCVPQPDDPSKAICFCDVEEGKSLSTVPCDSLKPSTDVNGIRTVYSTFSFEQFKSGKKGMKCPSGTPWTWCLNKRCTVDPSNPTKAICSCDVVRTGEWTTLGGNCDTSTCKNGYWSGATVEDLEDASVFMTKKLGLSKSPVKWCPASS